MKTRAVVAGGLLALAGVWAISAVGQSMLSEPAEYPPASYEGRDYVDSEGCAFIRAGVDGNTTWVPRVTRDRTPICGLESTFTAQQLAALSGSGNTAMAAVAPTTSAIATPVMTKTTTASSTSMSSDIYVGSGSTARSSSMGTSVATNVPGQVANDIYIGGGAMSGSSTMATSVATNGSGQIVSDVYVGNGVSGGGAMSSNTYPTPTLSMGASSSGPVVSDVYVPNAGFNTSTYSPATTSALSIGIPNSGGAVPAGYKRAWDDGRINMQRGPRSSMGDASMNQVWTQTIPRQLIANAGNVGRVRSGIRSVVPWMSSKSEAPSGAGDFIQIGAFGSAANVTSNLNILSQMGMGAVVQDAGNVQVVLAGPFGAADLRSALSHLRSAGYSDAFVR